MSCPVCHGKGIIEYQQVRTSCSYCHGKGDVMTVGKDAVHHPSHYNMGQYEVIDVIEDWKLSFNLGNAVKYIARAEHKNAPQEDLKKAWWYITRELISKYGVHVEALMEMVKTVKKEVKPKLPELKS